MAKLAHVAGFEMDIGTVLAMDFYCIIYYHLVMCIWVNGVDAQPKSCLSIAESADFFANFLSPKNTDTNYDKNPCFILNIFVRKQCKSEGKSEDYKIRA